MGFERESFRPNVGWRGFSKPWNSFVSVMFFSALLFFFTVKICTLSSVYFADKFLMSFLDFCEVSWFRACGFF